MIVCGLTHAADDVGASGQVQAAACCLHGHPTGSGALTSLAWYKPWPSLQAVAWLKLKARRGAQALAASSLAFADMGPPALFAYSVGLVGEYLSPAWLERLQAACDLPPAGRAPIACAPCVCVCVCVCALLPVLGDSCHVWSGLQAEGSTQWPQASTQPVFTGSLATTISRQACQAAPMRQV